MKPYRFHRDARTEYRAALAWYATRSLDAAYGFAEEIHAVMAQRRRASSAVVPRANA